jgi:hypothetical protein
MQVKELQIKIIEEYADRTSKNDFKTFRNSSIKMQRQETGPYCSIVTGRSNQTAMLHDI